MASCMKLKSLIQDLIESKDITIEQQAMNQDLKIYMNLMPDHNKGKEKGKGANYTNFNHVYDHVVASLDEFVIVINIKGPSIECGVTTRRGTVTIQGPSPPPRGSSTIPKSNPNDYSFLD